MIAFTIVDPAIAAKIQSGGICELIHPSPARLPARGERFQIVDRQLRPVIPDPICRNVSRCDIAWEYGRIVRMRQAGIPVLNLDKLAQACGYPDADRMAARLYSMTPGPFPTEAWIIEWIAPEAMMMEMA